MQAPDRASLDKALSRRRRNEARMSKLLVCPLSRLAETVDVAGATHLVTLINVNTPVVRPPRIAQDKHLFIGVSDIVEPMDGHVLPGEDHVLRLLTFMRAWNRASPLVIHCWAGISRSTAAAFITSCLFNPGRDERDIAEELRMNSPSATPNPRLVAAADRILSREGRMSRAVTAIGRGADAYEGAPFEIKI
jgi:predicted protein tyrosine phosphatase